MRYKRQPPKGNKKRPEADNDRKSGSERGQFPAPAMKNEPSPRIGENGKSEKSNRKARKNDAETEPHGSKNSKKR